MRNESRLTPPNITVGSITSSTPAIDRDSRLMYAPPVAAGVRPGVRPLYDRNFPMQTGSPTLYPSRS
jgi:hypothetical protein